METQFLRHMLPCSPSNDVVNVLAVESVLNTENFCSVSSFTGNVFGSHLTNFFLCNLGILCFGTTDTTLALSHVVAVIYLSSRNYVQRINARRIVASVSSKWLWPSSVMQVKGNPMRQLWLSAKKKRSIALGWIAGVLGEWPDDAFIAGSESDCLSEPSQLFGRFGCFSHTRSLV